MSDPVAVYGDGLYGDGGLYESNDGIGLEYITTQEVQGHWIAAKLTYVATVIPGTNEAFRIYSIRMLLAPDRQVVFTYNAEVDAVTTSERVSLRLTATTNFQINHLQLLGSRKRHQPKG